MIAQRQTFFWVGATFALFLLLWLLGDILLPFVLGAGIAYLLDPLADRLESFGLSRMLSTIIIVAVFALLLIAALLLLIPLLVTQLGEFTTRLPIYIQRSRDLIATYAGPWLGDFASEANRSLEQAVADFIKRTTGSMGKVLETVWSGGMVLVNTLALLIVTPVVASYFLLDWDKMVAKIDAWLPRDHVETIRALARDIDGVMSGFIRGQVTVLLLLGTMYALGLSFIGLNFGLLIGVLAGVISFIPYIGPIVGFLVGGTVALVQFGSNWVPIAGVIGVFAVGQVIESNILSPMIVGERVKLHPVWLIFALFVFGYLFGFVGLLLAVPAAAAIGVLVRFALKKYLESPLYYGDHGGRDETAEATKPGGGKHAGGGET